MKVYVVIVQDRHIDVQASVFSHMDVAISKARDLANEYCRYSEYFKEYYVNTNVKLDDGYLYTAVYSCEDDQVSVVATELDVSISE